jgi:branched-chain amino acid transport system permease protein
MAKSSLYYSFTPIPLAKWFASAALVLIALIAPIIFSSNFAISVLTQIGIASIACLSFNMLFGQGGMLSFGHAVYTGLGAYVAIHALNAVGSGALSIPVTLIPLVGGLGSLFFALLLGFVSTRRSGTTFSMITLGMAELVFAMSLMFSDFFGGEAGVSSNRVVGESIFGITYGPPIQVYYLTAGYTMICIALMYAFTLTPLGRILNAVRDNPERVEFIGYNTQYVRYFAFLIAAFFAGIAGGLACLNFEIVTAEVVGSARSGAYMLFTYLGGSSFFFGPVIGAILMVLAFVLLSDITKAWLLYLGLSFLLMVMYAPGGIASLLMMNVRVIKFGRMKELILAYSFLLISGLLMMAGVSSFIEMVYHLKLSSEIDSQFHFAFFTLDTGSFNSWMQSYLLAVFGIFLFEFARRNFSKKWMSVQSSIHDEFTQKEDL